MKPPIMRLSPVWTGPRVLMLARLRVGLLFELVNLDQADAAASVVARARSPV